MSELPNDIVKEFVIASHFNLEKVKALLAEHPELLRVQYDWAAMGGLEDGIGAAAHVGNREIAEFFIAQGVEPNICVLAILGRTADVRAMLTNNPALANARGAHGIPIMFHTAMSGEVELAEMLKNAGCTEGYNDAIHGAIRYGHEKMVAWLLKNGVSDATKPDYENKTPLERAKEGNQTAIIGMLEAYGVS